MPEVVYHAFRGADLKETFGRLRAAGLHPVMMDDPNPDPVLAHAAHGSLRIRIAVPPGEVAAAYRVLHAAGRATDSTRTLARSFERGCVRYVLVGTALGILAALAYRIEPDFPWQIPALAILGVWTIFLWIRAHRRAEH